MKQYHTRRAVILANGSLYEPDYARSLLTDDDFIVVANGGSRLAHELGVIPHFVIGDADSLPPVLRRWLDEHHVPREAHPRYKDATDLELALRYVLDRGITSVLFLGATGSRVDHTLANISLLALAHAAGIQAEVVVARQHLYVVYSSIRLQGEPGQTVSLLPWGGDVEGVTTTGLEWELSDASLPFGPARGISNIMLEETATISIRKGMLLVVQQRGDVL